MSHLYAATSSITKWGNTGKCHQCDRVTEQMYLVRYQVNKNWITNTICYNCARSVCTTNDFASGKIFLTDAKFKCPASSCDKTALSFWDFIYATCCDTAFKEKYSVNLSEINCKEKVDYANFAKVLQTLEVVEKEELATDEAVDVADKQLKSAALRQKIVHEQREKIQARVAETFFDAGQTLGLGKLKMQSNGNVVKQKSDTRFTCNICKSDYNKGKKWESAPRCGHRACMDCLKKIENKLCPECKKPFTHDEIIKLY